MRTTSILLLLLLAISSCKSKEEVPAGVLPELQMRRILWDVMRSGQYINAYVINRDTAVGASENQRFNQRIFEMHKTTKKQFDESFAYYRQHPSLMKRIMDSLAKEPPVLTEASPALTDTIKYGSDTSRGKNSRGVGGFKSIGSPGNKRKLLVQEPVK